TTLVSPLSSGNSTNGGRAFSPESSIAGTRCAYASNPTSDSRMSAMARLNTGNLVSSRGLSPETRARRISSLAAVTRGRPEVPDRPGGHDAARVDGAMAPVIVPLDVLEVDGVGDSGLPVQVAREARQVGVVDEPPQVALEVPVVHGVEADEGGEQAPVGLREGVAGEVAAPGQALVQPVQGLEQRQHRLLVGFLRGGEA